MFSIISGCQTGVDRAALDAAMKAGIDCGGFVPRGKFAEDGRIPDRYPVYECDSPDYDVRTELNVINSDATLILNRGIIDGGTAYTLGLCRHHGKPVSVIDLDNLEPRQAAAQIQKFLQREKPQVLNVAGPRESKSPGIYALSLNILLSVLNGASPEGA